MCQGFFMDLEVHVECAIILYVKQVSIMLNIRVCHDSFKILIFQQRWRTSLIMFHILILFQPVWDIHLVYGRNAVSQHTVVVYLDGVPMHALVFHGN